jgi:hypothetical protein
MGKLARKQAQAYRREAKQILARNQEAFDQKIAEKLKVFNDIVKPRPRFVPSWAWKMFAKIFLDVAKLQEFLGVNKPQPAPEVVNIDNQIGVEIFRLLHDRLPNEDGTDEISVADFDLFIARFGTQRKYKTITEHARRLRDIEKKRVELSTEKTS